MKNFSLCALALFGWSAFAQDAEYVYVESNLKAANSNSIFAFRRNPNGDLALVPGSPFLTGGAGIQDTSVNVGPIDSDQNIITNRDHSLLFAVNSGSDTIAVFRIAANGALTPVEGSPFPSGGNNPVSLALDGSVLHVVNKSGDFGRASTMLPNYTTLRLTADAKLVPFGDTANDSSRVFQHTVSVSAGSSPTQAFIVPGQNLLFGVDFLGGLVQRFRYNDSGELRPLPPLALPASEFPNAATPRLPLGMWGHPHQPLLYVGFVTASKVGVYRYGRDGSLSFLRAVPSSGRAVCWFRTNRAGNRLYSSSTISNSIEVYDATDPERPVQMQQLVLSGVGNVLQFELTADGRYLYAMSSRGLDTIPQGQGNILHILQVQTDGTVKEVNAPVPFNLPASTRPQGVLTVTK